MKRHSSLIPLSREHQKALIASQVLTATNRIYNGYPDTIKGKLTYYLELNDNLLLPHFKEEENQFQTHLSGRFGLIDDLINKMVEEHKQFYLLTDLVREGTDIDNNLRSIGLLLNQHIRFEERQLFEAIQSKFEEETLLKLNF